MDINNGKVLFGVKVGEHSFSPENAIEEFKARVIDRGFDYVYIRPKLSMVFEQEDYVKWARFLAENKVYFHFGALVQNPPPGKKSKIDEETIAKMREVAGKYFLGETVREPGTHYAAKAPGYFNGMGKEACPQKHDCIDMREAHEHYINTVGTYVKTDKETGIPHVSVTEATSLTKYDIEAGVDMPLLEVMNGSPDDMLPSVRGAARCYDLNFWGTLIAHEWYGGVRHDDVLKRKRLSLAMKSVYIAGTGSIMLESGDEKISSYGHSFEEDSTYCEEYRRALKEIYDFAKKDVRPLGGPKVKLGIVFGLHDGWTGFCQSSVWNQFGREEWGHGEAEFSYRLLDELGTKRKWGDNSNYGDYDLSSSPAYGQYDLVPIESDVEHLCRYDYLIMLGYNTMTDENMDKLTEYARRGGRLLLSGAHLNYSVKREGEFIPPSNEKLEALCGVSFTGKLIKTNRGSKFEYDSLDPLMLYPGTKSFICDPLFSAGYTEYMDLLPKGARALAFASDAFVHGRDVEPIINTVFENKVGEGYVTLIASINYPGNPAVYPLYRAMAREFVTASARACEIKVIASEKLRYAVYEGNKIYLLNTDYDLPITVKIIYNGKEQLITLNSLELKAIEL